MSKRKSETQLTSWPEVDLALARLCVLAHRRQVQESNLTARLNEIRAAYAESLEELAREDAALRDQVEQFALAHPEAFSPVKSVERLHGVLSFRTTPPAVKILRRPWTEAERIAAVRSTLGPSCVRTFEEVAKDEVLAAFSAGRITPDQLADAGLRIGRREEFSLELKQEAMLLAPGPQA